MTAGGSPARRSASTAGCCTADDPGRTAAPRRPACSDRPPGGTRSMTLLETASTAVDRPWEVLLGGRPMRTAARYEIEDPTTGRRLADVPDLSPEEVGRVV